jgi:D-glycero-alpha-D-manno-heptose-7-phosphate kinase
MRISFGGGGTDLEAYFAAHGGLVVSATISRYCTVIAREPSDRQSRIISNDYGIRAAFDAGVAPAIEQPLALPKAALAWFIDRGLCTNGVELALSSDVPPGSGLGSSSAMAVALVHALAAYTGISLDATQAAELACALEIEHLGMPIGKQDQYASAVGGLNTIEFGADRVCVTPIELPPGVAAALDARLLLFSTGQTRDSASILRRQQADTRSSAAVIGSLHTIKALAIEMRAALMDADLDRFGQLLDRSWRHKRRLSNNISSPAIDRYYAAALDAGALGGKIAGAGGGGFMLLYCPPGSRRNVRGALAQFELRELPFSFEAAGAHVLGEQAARSVFSIAAPLLGQAEPRPDLLQESIAHYWRSFADVMQRLSAGALARVAQALLDCQQRGGTIFILGNGGSAATASHFACDLAKGTRVAGQAGFRVVPLTDNVPLLTAWGNDSGYERVFAEQLAPLVRPGDVVVAISVSGNSPNVLLAIEAARGADATTVALTGGMGGQLGRLVDQAIFVPDGTIEQVEDAHMIIAHSLCVALRQQCQAWSAQPDPEPARHEMPAPQPLAIELGR